MKFQHQAASQRSPRQSGRATKNEFFWYLTLAGVLFLLGSALVRVWNPADSTAAAFTRTPPGQLRADARTLVEIFRYMAEPETGALTFAGNTDPGSLSLVQTTQSVVCECCPSNHGEIPLKPATNGTASS